MISSIELNNAVDYQQQQSQIKNMDFITMLKTSDINEFYIKEHLSKSLESTIISQGFNKIETDNGYVRWAKNDD